MRGAPDECKSDSVIVAASGDEADTAASLSAGAPDENIVPMPYFAQSSRGVIPTSDVAGSGFPSAQAHIDVRDDPTPSGQQLATIRYDPFLQEATSGALPSSCVSQHEPAPEAIPRPSRFKANMLTSGAEVGGTQAASIMSPELAQALSDVERDQAAADQQASEDARVADEQRLVEDAADAEAAADDDDAEELAAEEPDGERPDSPGTDYKLTSKPPLGSAASSMAPLWQHGTMRPKGFQNEYLFFFSSRK
jgi:hypothetical protein